VNVALVRAPQDDLTIPTSLTCRWLGDAQDGERRDGILVRTFEDARTRSTWIVCAHNDAEVFISNQVGALITGAMA
jgi:hypothetical protein